MRVAVVSTYPPRPCGIGTFSRDLRSALIQADPATAVDIVSIVRQSAAGTGPTSGMTREIATTIRQDVRSDYAAVGRILTSRGTDVVLLEHEYGIFGGEAGSFVLSLLADLRQPLVVTMHTVLDRPSVRQAETLRELCHRATLVTVFTETARRMVVDARLVPPERVRVVPHGAPSILTRAGRDTSPEALRRRMAAAPRPALEKLEGRRVLSTFGLISPGKGIELAIEALPQIVEAHPDVLYLVAGQTHPDVVSQEGERYRLYLERLVRDLELTDHVHFLDRFLTVEDLAALLSATDVYLTPYTSPEQIVSGALTYAIAAGCPVVSTPYRYAEDLLASGAGVLVPFGDPTAFADGVLGLLGDPEALATARREAQRIGNELNWPAVGEQTLRVLAEAVELGPVTAGELTSATASSPRVRPDHLLTLVDDVGIVQHADGIVPNRASGYCVDDMARLAIVALLLDGDYPDPMYRRMLSSGLSFLRHAWDPSVPGMHNLMSYERQWLDQPHLGDHVGRAAWALGEVIAAQPARAEAVPASRLLTDLAPALESLSTPRGVAYALLGLGRPETAMLPEPLPKVLAFLADRLARWYAESRRDDWRWFEDRLTYDNARLPQALISAGHRLGDETMIENGLEALDWYAEQCRLNSNTVRLVGNRWRRRGVAPLAVGEEGDEQPLDAAALVEACVDALAMTGRRQYGQWAVRAFEGFLGRNSYWIPVYDFATGGSHDGLGSDGVNQNEGAESTLAFFQSLLALDEAGLQASLPSP
jgi:glycosyltransferase involved in cell wall biosynthesis